MIDITVVRFKGDRPGEDVIEPLLTEVSAAVARGTYEMNRQSRVPSEKPVNCAFRTGFRGGQIVELNDSILGAPVRGRIKNIRHIVRGVSEGTQGEVTIETELGLDVPTRNPDEFTG